MWLEKLKNIHNQQVNLGPLSYLNLRYDLHLAIYVIETLKDIVLFDYDKGKSILKIKHDKKDISLLRFMYWWQVTRIKEIFIEETKIISSFEAIKNKITKLKKNLPVIEEDDSEKEKKLKKEMK